MTRFVQSILQVRRVPSLGWLLIRLKITVLPSTKELSKMFSPFATIGCQQTYLSMHLQQAFLLRPRSVFPYWWTLIYLTQWVGGSHCRCFAEVCSDVCTEPNLQPLSGESLHYSTASKKDGASRHQQVFFNLRVFNPNASSYRHFQLATAYSWHEQLK